MKKLSVAAALLLFALRLPFAETSYDLTAIVELAMRENATIQRNRIELNALKRKADKRWSAFVPSISVAAGASRADGAPAMAGTASVAASLAVSASTLSDIGQTRLNYESGLISGAATAREIELSVRKLFYLILYEREYIDYIKRTVETAKRQYELTAKNQQAGLLPILDTLSAQVNYRNATLTLASAESDCVKDLDSLKQAAGIPQGEAVNLTGSLDASLPKDRIRSGGIGPASSYCALLEKKLEAALAASRMASIGVFAPTLSCSAVTRNVLQAPIAGGSPLVPDITVSLAFSIGDLLPWSAAKETALAASDSVNDIELQLSAAKSADFSTFESLRRDIENAERTIETRRLTVSLAEESYRQTETAYEAGTKDLIALKSASDALQEAKAGLLKDRYGLISAVLDIEYLCGVPFGSLSEEQ